MPCAAAARGPALPDDRIDWKAKELPVDHRTVTVLGSVWKADAPWGGLDFTRAILREKSTIMMVCLGRDKAPADHHLDVPWCHPDDQPGGWVDGMRYRVRPRRKGWCFAQVDGAWRLVRAAAVTRPLAQLESQAG